MSIEGQLPGGVDLVDDDPLEGEIEPVKVILCAVVDAAGVYLGMADADMPIAEGAKRLPQISECDLAPGESRWVEDEANPYGGEFVPIPKEKQATPAGVTDQQAIAFFMLAQWQRDPTSVPQACVDWLNHVVRTFDFVSLARAGNPAIAAFVAANPKPE